MTMTLWTSLTTIAGIWLLTVLSPGPNLLATVYTATTQSRRRAVMLCAGISAGTAIWACASLLGLGLLFQTTAWLYQVVRLVGGAWLVYLGLRTILCARARDANQPTHVPVVSAGRAFWRGMLVDLSNPKAAIFFTSLFAVTVPPEAPVWFKGLIVVLVVAMAGGWYALVAWLANAGPVVKGLQRANRLMAYATGGAFIIIGTRIASAGD